MSARTWFVIDALLVVLNLLAIAILGGGVWNGIAAVACTTLAVPEFHQWRAEVADERRRTA